MECVIKNVLVQLLIETGILIIVYQLALIVRFQTQVIFINTTELIWSAIRLVLMECLEIPNLKVVCLNVPVPLL